MRPRDIDSTVLCIALWLLWAGLVLEPNNLFSGLVRVAFGG